MKTYGIKIYCATEALNREVQRILHEALGCGWGNAAVGWNAGRQWLVVQKGVRGWFLNWTSEREFTSIPLQAWTAEDLIESYRRFLKDGTAATSEPAALEQDAAPGAVDAIQQPLPDSKRTAALVTIGMAAVAAGWREGDLSAFVAGKLLGAGRAGVRQPGAQDIAKAPSDAEIVAACFKQTGLAQGTPGGKQFLSGARWMLERLGEIASASLDVDRKIVEAAWVSVAQAAQKVAKEGGEGKALCNAIDHLTAAIMGHSDGKNGLGAA